MVVQLNHNNQKFHTILIDRLRILAFNNFDSKVASGGPKERGRFMHTSNYEKLLWTTVRLMKILNICSSNKPALIKSGAL